MHVELTTLHEAQQTRLLRQPLDAGQQQAAHCATELGADDDYQPLPMKLTDLAIVLSLILVCWAVVVGAGLAAWNVVLSILASLGWPA